LLGNAFAEGILLKKLLTDDVREDDIGGTFKYRSYENAELVSSKQLTAFSDHRFPLQTPDHVTLPQYVQYLRSYCDQFKLWPNINFRCRVTNIRPLPEDEKWRHRITYADSQGKEQQFDCSHIALCTGLHVQPNVPSIPGIENVKGEVFHSSSYKFRSQLSRHDVLILGCGETAMGRSLPIPLQTILS
jgi:dimethylaniline monooxygenase (N-oxide forming)